MELERDFDRHFPVGKLHPFTYMNSSPRSGSDTLHEEIWAYVWMMSGMLHRDEVLSPWTIRQARTTVASCPFVICVSSGIARMLRDDEYREYLCKELSVSKKPETDHRRHIDPFGPYRVQIREYARTTMEPFCHNQYGLQTYGIVVSQYLRKP